ncbi:hypothetical protein ILT44_27925 [Microvirga sp. BT689]|uniref:hypothetical protein n=1 Tax=Microvirga arvi TaxID=2778731 RepID=UPI0019511340|nr:hypothetical protein [Microvirga arvi]MBM6584033.1 hypothetical protein [Microvirga arvi]
MKRKNREKTELERRLEVIDARFVQHDRITRAAMLAGLIFGVAVLAVVASYLVCLSWITGP